MNSCCIFDKLAYETINNIDLSHFIMNFDDKMKIYILCTLFYFFGAKAESSNETFGNSYKEIKNYCEAQARVRQGRARDGP